MDDGEPSAPRAPIDREDLDDTVEAHYACLERPHACLEGWVFVGRLVVDEDGEEVEVIEAVPCRRCANSR